MLSNVTLAKEVHRAIKNGARTQAAICRSTKHGADPVCLALAYLLITKRAIRIETQGNTRRYLPAQQPRRGKLDAPLSFSTLRALMPGRMKN